MDRYNRNFERRADGEWVRFEDIELLIQYAMAEEKLQMHYDQCRECDIRGTVCDEGMKFERELGPWNLRKEALKRINYVT